MTPATALAALAAADEEAFALASLVLARQQDRDVATVRAELARQAVGFLLAMVAEDDRAEQHARRVKALVLAHALVVAVEPTSTFVRDQARAAVERHAAFQTRAQDRGDTSAMLAIGRRRSRVEAVIEALDERERDTDLARGAA